MSKPNLLAQAFTKTTDSKPVKAVQSPKQKAEKNKPSTSKGRQGKKTVIAYFDPAVVRELKLVGADQDKTMQDLIAEGVNEVLVKYGKKPIA